MPNTQDDLFSVYRQALAINIKKHRKLRNISAEEMAAMLGVSKRHYYKMESYGENQVVPQADRLPFLASVFGVTLDELCGMSPPTSSLSSDEALLLQYFRKLPDPSQAPMLNIFRSSFLSRFSSEKLKKLSEFLMMK